MTAYCIIKPYIPEVEPGMHHWRISLGGMTLLCVARSHQAAKKVALAYWALHGASFAQSIRQRISQKWRGGLKAVRQNQNLGAPASARWVP